MYLNIDDVVEILEGDSSDDEVANSVDDSTTESSEETCDMINFGLSEINSEITEELGDKSLIHGCELRMKKELANMQYELSKLEDHTTSF